MDRPLSLRPPQRLPSFAAPRAPVNDLPRLQHAARDFEAQVLAFLFQPLFAGVALARSPFGGGAAEAQWQPLLIEAYAAAAARAGRGLGIAALLLHDLAQRQRLTSSPPETHLSQTGETAP